MSILSVVAKLQQFKAAGAEGIMLSAFPEPAVSERLLTASCLSGISVADSDSRRRKQLSDVSAGLPRQLKPRRSYIRMGTLWKQERSDIFPNIDDIIIDGGRSCFR